METPRPSLVPDFYPEMEGAVELDDSAKKTTVLRQYLKDLFSQYVERRAAPAASTPESIRTILAKRRTDIIQSAVEAAAANDLPIEASFEHRHEVKGDDPASSKKVAKATDSSVTTEPIFAVGSAATTPVSKAAVSVSAQKAPKGSPRAVEKQQAQARRVAQKFVEPALATGMVQITKSAFRPNPKSVIPKQASRGIVVAAALGFIVGLIIIGLS